MPKRLPQEFHDRVDRMAADLTLKWFGPCPVPGWCEPSKMVEPYEKRRRQMKRRLQRIIRDAIAAATTTSPEEGE